MNNIKSWKKNVAGKALALGVPYVTFMTATWVLKTVFSDIVSKQADSLLKTLLLSPSAPYWYLYALFFIFLITPTFTSLKVTVAGLLVATAAKGLILTGGDRNICCINRPHKRNLVCAGNESICAFNVELRGKKLQGIVIGLLFLGLSIAVHMADVQNLAVSFVLGLIACAAVILLAVDFEEKSGKAMRFFAKYTMPIFLIHTLSAASLRAVLLKIGITNAAVHVALGLGISFVGPIVAAWIMKRTKWLEFFLYPNKFLEKVKSR